MDCNTLGVRSLLATLLALAITGWAADLQAQVLARVLEREGLEDAAAAATQVDAKSPESRDADPVRASVGEGGRDLAARLRWELPDQWNAGVELHADAGDEPMLLGRSARYLRWQPLWMVGFAPQPELEVFAGAGVGAAHVMVEDDVLAEPSPVDAATTYSLAAQVGMRLTHLDVPLVALLRTDELASQAFAVRMALALELAP